MLAVTGRRAGLHASLTRFVSFGPMETERETRAPSTARVDARYLLESRPGASLAYVFAAGVCSVIDVTTDPAVLSELLRMVAQLGLM